MGITIAVPTLDIHRLRLARDLMATRMPAGVEVFLRELSHSLAIDKARNTYVRGFLAQETPTDRLWFVDDDMTWHPDSVTRLYERDLDIVHALTWTNDIPPKPTIWKNEIEKDGMYYYMPAMLETLRWLDKHEHKFNSNDPIVLPKGDDDLKETPVTGAAFLLVKRKVLEALDDPWFEGNQDGFGEDFAFCRKARKAGFKVYVDRSVIVTHLPRFPLGPLTFAAFMSIFREMTPEEEKQMFGEEMRA